MSFEELAKIDEEAAAHGISREELLKRAASAGVAIAGGGILARAAAAGIVQNAKPKRGGTFRVGVPGGSAKDFIDGQYIVTNPDIARLMTGWETLVVLDPKFKLKFDGLAEEVTPNKRGDQWTIRLRPGIEFHNGKTLTSADLRYSIQRLINPKLGLGGQSLFASVDPQRIKLLDKRTARLMLTEPDGTILDSLTQYTVTMVPVGYGPTGAGSANPNVGTGAYKLKSFTPGQQSVHVRNPNYWRHGQPYFDSVVIIDFPDDTARVNALLGGQVDAITDVPPALVSLVAGHSGTKILESPGAAWPPICMRVDQPPFNDARVRQAMRLIVDRPQMVQQAFSGHGRIGNDIYSPFDQAYDTALPQRHQDIEKAKSLLKAAGQDGLTIDLNSTNGALGMNEGAQVFAQQAKAAGVNVNVKILDSGTFYGGQYLKWVFSTDFWNPKSYLAQVAAGSLPTSPYNETHWPDAAHQNFLSLYAQAKKTSDTKKRYAIIHEMQKIEYDNGGYIVWGFNNRLDGYGTKLKGLLPGYKSNLALNQFGRGYRTLWFA
ncbi:MAG TPA: ABC transporter substrate-binding protein [Dehalococcoidia bacterium]